MNRPSLSILRDRRSFLPINPNALPAKSPRHAGLPVVVNWQESENHSSIPSPIPNDSITCSIEHPHTCANNPKASTLGTFALPKASDISINKIAYNSNSNTSPEFPMVSDEIGLKLHHRATTGGTLTPNEQAQLEAWYAAKDQAEAAIFIPINPSLPDPAILQAQIDQTLAQLAISVQQIQQITQENANLRQENANLKQLKFAL